VTSVVGDIATLHDLNSMDLIRKSEVPIHLIIINNNGGGIFSFLPIAEFDDVFEYFRTAHDITFDSAAKQFGLMYSRCTNTQNFREHYQKFSAGQQSSIIEVTIDAVHNYKSHHQFEKSIKAISI
jgi:2-succinyl-5-enolpyruvyl-6-hydroxy-3-cyclohexene-1-carboxylate synthase